MRSMNATACSATVAASREKLRSLITGLSGLVSTSTTGAKSIPIPSSVSWTASAAATLRRQVSVDPISPSRRIGGHSVQGSRSRCTRPPS